MAKVSNNNSRVKRKKRVRAKISGDTSRPRLTVYKSLRGIYAQVIDDSTGKTLAAANLAEIKKAKNTAEGAKELGKLIAKKCVELKIKTVKYDRAGYKYHGKIKSLAEGAREGGLIF
ncbi:MAG TPA: 50S ribosomal protein L18 [Candidatus Moranbacteria bacterium]|nr:50S ribosomal protein L18 [Candidatus Moranbacteria bacterium]HRY28240.1 50S ribosomal protein L18 [Candidatus Moranbacteria bacterium]HSA08329.1 50S ribosomal protein L18 [Candidatus Moranbacteria bacterium]